MYSISIVLQCSSTVQYASSVPVAARDAIFTFVYVVLLIVISFNTHCLHPIVAQKIAKTPFTPGHEMVGKVSCCMLQH